MSPEAPKLDDTPNRKRVKLTAAEKLMLGAADPNGPEATAFLELNGLKLGDEIIADVEGNDAPEIISLAEEDFFVRDREATESFTAEAASRAEQFVESEAEVTPESAAEHQELVKEFATDAGEVAVDEVEAEAGLPLKPFADTAQPAPWSKEARDRERAINNPTRDNPNMFDDVEDMVRIVSYTGEGNKEQRGELAGLFYENGRNIALIRPEKFDGTYIEVDADTISGQTRAKRPEAEPTETEDTSERPIGAASIEDIMSILPEERRQRDKIELESYAMADAGLMKDPDNEALNLIKHQNWNRMSADAKKLAGRYSQLTNTKGNMTKAA